MCSEYFKVSFLFSRITGHVFAPTSYLTTYMTVPLKQGKATIFYFHNNSTTKADWGLPEKIETRNYQEGIWTSLNNTVWHYIPRFNIKSESIIVFNNVKTIFKGQSFNMSDIVKFRSNNTEIFVEGFLQ